MSNTSRYTKAVAKGAAQGAKDEWDRANTIGGVVEYAIIPKPARAAYAGVRATVAATQGIYTSVKATRSEITSEQPTELYVVKDADKKRQA